MRRARAPARRGRARDLSGRWRLREDLFEPDFRLSRKVAGSRAPGFADYFSEFIANQP